MLALELEAELVFASWWSESLWLCFRHVHECTQFPEHIVVLKYANNPFIFVRSPQSLCSRFGSPFLQLVGSEELSGPCDMDISRALESSF